MSRNEGTAMGLGTILRRPTGPPLTPRRPDRLRHGLRIAFSVALLSAIAVCATLAGCGGGHGATEPSASGATANGPVVLTVVGEKGSRSYSLADLEKLPAYTGYAGIKNSVGVITAPERYTGVSLGTLLAALGGVDPTHGVTVLAKDGYGMTFSNEQAAGRGFTTFDPVTGAERPPADAIVPLIAYAQAGKPLDPAGDGPLRLVFATAKGDVVVDGHWSVRWVDKVEVKRSMGEWSVSVQGATRSTLTRASYVSCASPGCHGTGWVDSAGQRWEGVPLWLVAGSVDDGRTHGKGAFDIALARRGYRIELIGSTGAKAFLSSRDLLRHKDWLLAGKLDGSELTPVDFPLRLVGPGLTDDQSIGRITKIWLRPR
jgi:DMSO/TMAO reductase YedYZ molybdopterin-dependent catalytic subunit